MSKGHGYLESRRTLAVAPWVYGDPTRNKSMRRLARIGKPGATKVQKYRALLPLGQVEGGESDD